jgi:hypothetical protein
MAGKPLAVCKLAKACRKKLATMEVEKKTIGEVAHFVSLLNQQNNAL